jgi:hypothetical protein
MVTRTAIDVQVPFETGEKLTRVFARAYRLVVIEDDGRTLSPGAVQS